MIGDAFIIGGPFSRASNDFPYFGSGIPQSGGDIGVITIEDVKFTEDMVQTITIRNRYAGGDAVVSGYDVSWFSLILLVPKDGTGTYKQAGLYYWITDVIRSSTVNDAVDLTLEWCGPTSLLSRGFNVKGMWERLPTQIMKNQRVIPVEGMSVLQRFEEFGDHMGYWTDSDGTKHRLGWVTFTTTSTPNEFFGDGGSESTDAQSYTRGGQTASPAQGGRHGYSVTGNVVTSSVPFVKDDIGGYNIFGFPVLMDQFDTPSTAPPVGVGVYSDSGALFIRNAPTIWDVMSAIDVIGFTSADVVDVSFSFSCPYGWCIPQSRTMIWNKQSVEQPVFVLTIDGTMPTSFASTASSDGTVSAWTNSVVPMATEPNDTESEPCYYVCKGYTGPGEGSYTQFLTGNAPSEREYVDQSITFDNRYEQSIQIRDYTGTFTQEIPLDYASISGGTGTLKYAVHVHADYDGMFKHIIVYGPSYDATDAPDIVMQFAYNEPKLPYVSDLWSEYKARSMADDRNALIMNALTNAASIAVGGALGGALIGGASSAAINGADRLIASPGTTYGAITGQTGIAQGIARSQLLGSIGQQVGSGAMGIGQAMYSQYVKERAIKAQPKQAVSLGYGLNQVIIGAEFPPGIGIFYPNGTDDAVDTYVSRFGFPAKCYRNFYGGSLVEGFYQGSIIPIGSFSGARYNSVANDYMHGVRLTDYSSNIISTTDYTEKRTGDTS